ncbi:MAG TPA: haloacid dehalogenase type II [Myxococcaceae bacterium]|nr:haloacid dehalogenase type II [Myxococcaceae bacterium]
MNTLGITHISFDCYGTLIDWETGILEQALPRLANAGAKNLDAETVLRAFVKHEAELEAGPFRPYRDVLSETLARVGTDVGARLDRASCSGFALGLVDWPPFPDTVDALARLAAKYRLVILSNVDDDLFAHTARRLGNPFCAVITAQQVRSYKPALAHFQAARVRLGLSPSNWLHVAQSLYHDHAPAKSLGLRTVWVDRPTRLTGTGLAPALPNTVEGPVPRTVEGPVPSTVEGPWHATPDARTTTLTQVAELVGA